MKTQKNRLRFMIVLLVLTAVLAVVGFCILPDTLVMQISSSGTASNTMPKLLGLAIPTALCAIPAVLYYKSEGGSKYLTISVVGVLCFILVFAFNL